jgi:acetyl-CoA carboxylase carboxyl transferase subunit beta
MGMDKDLLGKKLGRMKARMDRFSKAVETRLSTLDALYRDYVKQYEAERDAWTNEKKSEEKGTPENLWTKCNKCEQIVYNKELVNNSKVCPKCGFCFPMRAAERVALLLDAGTEKELDADMESTDPLKFLDGKVYVDKVASSKKKSGLNDAVWSGTGEIDGLPVVLGIMDFSFMGWICCRRHGRLGRRGL